MANFEIASFSAPSPVEPNRVTDVQVEIDNLEWIPNPFVPDYCTYSADEGYECTVRLQLWRGATGWDVVDREWNVCVPLFRNRTFTLTYTTPSVNHAIRASVVNYDNVETDAQRIDPVEIGTPNIRVDSINVPSQITEGERISIDVSVVNSGSIGGMAEVELSENNVVIARSDVFGITAGGQKTISFPYERLTGTYTVCAEAVEV